MKYLFMMDYYSKKKLANGICTREIIEQLEKNNDNDIYTLEFGDFNDEYENKRFFCKKNLFYRYRDKYENSNRQFLYKVNMVLQQLNTLFYILIYPFNFLLFKIRYLLKAYSIISNNNIEYVVSVYNPFEAILAGYCIKLINRKVNWIIYSLDTLSNGRKHAPIPKKYTNKKGAKWEKIFFKRADLIIILECHRLHYQKLFPQFQKKIKYSGIPLLKITQSNSSMNNSNASKVILYAGALYRKNRNPDLFLSLLKEIAKTIDLRIIFYSRGDCEDVINRYKNDGLKISNNDYIDRDSLLEKYKQTDFFLNIGNADTEMIPSKIFEYISQQKPIIHICSNKKDPCIEYLMKYKYSCILNSWDSRPDNISKLSGFLNQKFNIDSYQIKLEEKFYKNMASYTCNLIEKIQSINFDSER